LNCLKGPIDVINSHTYHPSYGGRGVVVNNPTADKEVLSSMMIINPLGL
jgi:hypothetical protein